MRLYAFAMHAYHSRSLLNGESIFVRISFSFLRSSEFTLRMSRDSYNHLKRYLLDKKHTVLLNIIQEHLFIDGTTVAVVDTYYLQYMILYRTDFMKRSIGKKSHRLIICCSCVITHEQLLSSHSTN